eukprot:scaffold9159_cov121-Cylindrotheca_fusiformis.AAC.1
MGDVGSQGENAPGGIVSDTETASKSHEDAPSDSAGNLASRRMEQQGPSGEDLSSEQMYPTEHGGFPPVYPDHAAVPPSFAYPQPHAPPWHANGQPTPPGQPPAHLLHFFEAQMRDHAAAFANAAAGAAFVSAQIAADMASASTATGQQNLRHMPPSPAFMIPPIPMMQPYAPPQYGPSPLYDPSIHPGSEVAPYHHFDATSSFGDDSASWEAGHRRRKRQQRKHPSVENGQELSNRSPQSFASNKNASSGKRGRRRRRFQNDGSSDLESQHCKHQNRRRNRKVALASSSSDGGSTYNISKKKQRQPSDESLLGKTGVAALYEWCGKRRTTPKFTLRNDEEDSGHQKLKVEDFQMIVSIDGQEWGQGRGKNKISAKQEAARMALQALLNGVVFDDASGILIKLPEAEMRGNQIQGQWAKNKETTTAEDLAPNLAKQLAIGHENDSDIDDRMVGRRHRMTHVYPGTSTTSEEEDENVYYASRGASVCSALLHAMVQIDDRIPEAPLYTYQVTAVPSSSKDNAHLKRKADSPFSSQAVVHRGSFTCTATMGVEKEDPKPGQPSFEILQALGVGGTKREARHTASAKLLAKLFPNCKGMAAVKHAAEAARERYAADKALKQQSKRSRSSTDAPEVDEGRKFIGDERQTLSFAMSSNSPALPHAIEEHLLRALNCEGGQNRSKAAHPNEPDLARQHSRHKQLDEIINSSLQKLNEHDEDGRSRPDELTVDDVGRTVLRQATTGDGHWIVKLLEGNVASHSPVSTLGGLVKDSQMSSKKIGIDPFPLWSSSTIVLLLCRAIAPYEDPPLGFAAMTLGFSMERGRTLRVAQIASESHLPRERFIEVLQSFACQMYCSLEVPFEDTRALATIRGDDIGEILYSHLLFPPEFNQFFGQTTTGCLSTECEEEPLGFQLQAVQEETEELEENCSGPEFAVEKRNAKKAPDKPSKRSRVQ